MRLIINADDFGFSESVNESIFHLAKLGSLTSTTVMVNEPYANEIEKLLFLKNLGIGLHFNITRGCPISQISEISSLVDNNGQFFSSKEFRNRAVKGTIKVNHILKELEAQFEKLKGLIGDRITHLDSHQNIYKYLNVSSAIVEFSKQKNYLGLRSLSRYHISIRKEPEKAKFNKVFKYGMKEILIEAYYSRLFKKLSNYYKLTDGVLKIHNLKILSELNPPNDCITLEISCHPATNTKDLLQTDYTINRVAEYQTMKSLKFINSLKKFKLINFSHL
jgi:predicted glycoside hydrolase/deacetylase ChbG (UPF0249 family)